MIGAAVKSLVHARARYRCEYCQTHQDDDPLLRFHIEHVVPRVHGGSDAEHNLALACHYCNLFKGPNLSGIDPHSGHIVPLFHPRRQQWKRHFHWVGGRMTGRTRSGRATVVVLRVNLPWRVSVREMLMATGRFPPT